MEQLLLIFYYKNEYLLYGFIYYNKHNLSIAK